MMSPIRTVALAVSLAIPSLAVAQSVNEADAKSVEAHLLSFVGGDLADSGALAVKAAGDRYEVLFDLRKAFEKSIAPWAVKDANAILHTLRPAGDRLWEYAGQGEVRLATDLAAANRSSSVTLRVGSFENKGMFDERLHFIRSGEFKSGDVKLVMRSAQDSLRIEAENCSVKVGFREEKLGLGDMTADVVLHGVSESVGTFPNPELKFAGGVLTGRFQFEDVDFNGIAKLIEFWNGSAKGKAIATMTDAERAAFSKIVADHAPFVKQAGENMHVDGASVTWAKNTIKIENLAYRWALEDIGGDAALILAVRARNPIVDVIGLPASMKKALPREASLVFRYSGIKLSAMWEALADPKIMRDALATKNFLGKTILPQEKVRVDFDGTYFRSPNYDISVSGGMDMPFKTGKPDKGDILVTAKDFDKTIKFLQGMAKEDPSFGQISFTAMMMKGLGKVQSDGSVLWHVEADGSGKITVNGQPVPGR